MIILGFFTGVCVMIAVAIMCLAYKYRADIIERWGPVREQIVQAFGQTRDAVMQAWITIRPRQNGEGEQQNSA